MKNNNNKTVKSFFPKTIITRDCNMLKSMFVLSLPVFIILEYYINCPHNAHFKKFMNTQFASVSK